MAKKKKQLTKEQVEKISRANAEAIVRGTSKLKSYGHSGYYKLKTTGKWIHFRSELERKVYLHLDHMGVIDDMDGEILIIPYIFKGATLNYVPDICLKTKSGKVYVIEVKPSDELNEEKNIAKWEKARTFCFTNNAKFVVVTEKTIESLTESIV